MDGMAQNLVCLCIWNTLFWRQFDSVKLVKFTVSGQNRENAWRLEIWCAVCYVSLTHSELIR